jgi:hypothetical protein
MVNLDSNRESLNLTDLTVHPRNARMSVAGMIISYGFYEKSGKYLLSITVYRLLGS